MIVQPILKFCQAHFAKKIRETLKSVLAIFDVFSRQRVDSGKIRNGIEFSTPVAT
jgi:hypothetical protein